jgi:hypothetical protein
LVEAVGINTVVKLSLELNQGLELIGFLICYHISRKRMVSLFLSQRFELGFHRGVAVGEFFNRDVLGFVVGEAEVAAGAEEGVFGLLEVGDRLVQGSLLHFPKSLIVSDNMD